MADSGKTGNPKADDGRRQPRRVSAAGRQDGDYPVEFTTPPKGGPIPDHRPIDEPASAQQDAAGA